MEGKYLYFASGTTAPDAVGESILYPVNSIAGVEPFASTKLKIFFTPRNTSSFVEDDNEFVVLKITSNKHKQVMDAIIAEINSGSRDGGFITVSDEPNSISLNSDILTTSTTATALVNSGSISNTTTIPVDGKSGTITLGDTVSNTGASGTVRVSAINAQDTTTANLTLDTSVSISDNTSLTFTHEAVRISLVS